MKKLFALLLSLVLLLCAAGALAEAAPVSDEVSSLPLTTPAIPGEIHTFWKLFADDSVELPQVTGVAQADGKDFVVTITGLEGWGLAAERFGGFRYDTEAEEWVADASVEAAEGVIALAMDAEWYYMNGFQNWSAMTADETSVVGVLDYSDDPNNPDYHFSVYTDESVVQISLAGNGYVINSYSEKAMSYCVYDAASMLELGSYMTESEDGAYASYAVIPNESSDAEAVAKEPYVLYYINVQTPDGGDYLWTDGAWQDIEGNEVEAPEGFSADELPFEVILY